MSSIFFNTPFHSGLAAAGQTIEWLPMDTKERHEQNLQDPTFAAIADSNGWTASRPIEYNINSQGFRGKEFDNSVANIVTLGCSFTIGTGLREHETWPYLLGNKLGLHVHNIAQGGWSTDTLFRMAHYWIPQLAPDLVIMLAPTATRLELKKNEHEYLNITSHDNITRDNYLQNWFSNQQNYKLNQLKNTLAIEMICKQLNIKFICYSANVEMPTRWALNNARVPKNPTNIARDNMHCGSESHVAFVEKILKDLHV